MRIWLILMIQDQKIYIKLPENVKLFGDNFSGDFAGFDLTTKNNLVVEFWHDDNKVVNTGKTFREYIREKLSMNTQAVYC